MLGFGCIPVRRSRGRTGLLGSSPALPGGLGPGDAQGLWGWGCAWGQPARGPGAAHTPWFGAGGTGVASGAVTAFASPQRRSQRPYLLLA